MNPKMTIDQLIGAHNRLIVDKELMKLELDEFKAEIARLLRENGELHAQIDFLKGVTATVVTPITEPPVAKPKRAVKRRREIKLQEQESPSERP